MSYFTQTDLEVLIPPGWVVEALDDDADGSQDATLFSELRTVVEGRINGKLGLRYTVPITSGIADDFLRDAAIHIAAGILYARRGLMDRFPYASELAEITARLNAIAAGELPLAPEADRAKDSVTAITDTARARNSGGRLNL